MKVTREEGDFRAISVVLESREDLRMLKNVCDRNFTVAEALFGETEAGKELGLFLGKLFSDLFEAERL